MTTVPAFAQSHNGPDGKERSVVTAPAADKPGVPLYIYDALETIQKGLHGLESFNHYEWDETGKRLKIHYHGAPGDLAPK